MIQFVVTIGKDPDDGQLGISIAKQGAAVGTEERIAEDYFREAIQLVAENFGESLLEQGVISAAVQYTADEAKNEGAAFEQRVKESAAAWRCERCGKTVAGESKACFCAKCEQEVRR